MGFRFRKSVKAGPLRINFSKSGIGYSLGGKGYRYTKKANGGTRQTWSIPGTGLSYVKESSAKKKETKTMQRNTDKQLPSNRQKAPKVCPICGAEITAQETACPVCGELLSTSSYTGKIQQATAQTTTISTGRNTAKQKKPVYKRWWFIWLMASLIYGCISMCTNSAADLAETLPAEVIDITAHATEATKEENVTEETSFPSIAPPETETPITEAPTEAPTENPATEAPTPPTIVASTEQKETERDYVLNTNTRKFHYPGCSSVDNIKDSNRADFTGTRSDVISMGYSPCGRCDP